MQIFRRYAKYHTTLRPIDLKIFEVHFSIVKLLEMHSGKKKRVIPDIFFFLIASVLKQASATSRLTIVNEILITSMEK